MAVTASSHVELFRDDFSKFPPGWLSKPIGLLNGAIQEYHYLPHRGVPTFPWFNPITYNDSWVAGDEDGKTYLEQHLISTRSQSALQRFELPRYSIAAGLETVTAL